MDFLIEALDAWHARKKSDPTNTPQHKVLIKTIVGTSGGGVTGAIAARALAYSFPPVHAGMDDLGPNRDTGNPLFDTWVNHLDLSDMLAVDDIGAGKKVRSLLNGSAIDKAATTGIGFVGGTLAEPRAYLPPVLPLILTTTNVKGIPYRLDMGTGTQTFVNHGDYIRVAVIYSSQSVPANSIRRDEFSVGFGPGRTPNYVNWTNVGEFAKATSAFPIGFPAREILRPIEHYRYRVKALPYAIGADRCQVVPMVPIWDQMRDPNLDAYNYKFSAFDGGVWNNEPIELARTALAGYDQRNPREPERAKRGVLLVDPFGGENAPLESKPDDLIQGVQLLFGSFKNQSRYSSQDILLALDPNVFSRFMISAKRGQKYGNAALATSGLGAFLGFACRAFRYHDYILGRQNCQAFLQNEFVLPLYADAFNVAAPGGARRSSWTGLTPPVLPTGAAAGADPQFPIIPLYGDCAVKETLAKWPTGEFHPEQFRDAIETRYEKILGGEFADSFLAQAAAWLVGKFSEGTVANFIINKMKEEAPKAEA